MTNIPRPSATDHGYLLDNRADATRTRFAALSALFDPVTFAHIDALGITPGWRCWEVGAGGLSVPHGLADRVGPGGHVLATDIDTGWIGADLPSTVEVRRHDVAADAVPGGGFDLVHARLVLVHIPDRDRALRRMVQALRPGGVLLVEDFDVVLQPLARLDPYTADHHRANQLREGFTTLLAQRGVDLEYGRKLPRLLAEHGLTGVQADAYLPIAHPAMDALESANLQQVGHLLVAHGLADADTVHRHLATLKNGLGLASPPLVSAWGFKKKKDETPPRFRGPVRVRVRRTAAG